MARLIGSILVQKAGAVSWRRDSSCLARTGGPNFCVLAEVLLGRRRAGCGGLGGRAAGRIINSGLRFHVQEGAQGSLWEERVVLDEIFWKALRGHPVPLQEAAIRELRDRSMSLDIYVWLAWRLHTLTKATPIS